MRILLLTTDTTLAGAERVVADLAAGLQASGVAVSVAGLMAVRPDAGDLVSHLAEQGIPVTSCGLTSRTEPWKLARLVRCIRRTRPDLLPAHPFHANLAAAVLAGIGGAHLLWTHHNMDARVRGTRGRVYRALWGRVHHHVFVSRSVRDYHRAHVGTHPCETVVPNGVDLAPYLRLRPGPSPVVGALGRLVPEKGFGDLVSAFARFRREVPDARLRIAGEGPDRDRLQARIRADGLEACVELPGFISDVPGFLSELGLFVHPSHGEGYGRVIVEALAAGVPVAASSLAPLREVGGEAVAWFEPRSVPEMLQAMRRMHRRHGDAEASPVYVGPSSRRG